jgi:2'-5' RNA ligase
LFINVLEAPGVLEAQELMTLQAELMQHLEDTLNIVDEKNKRHRFSPHMTVAFHK